MTDDAGRDPSTSTAGVTDGRRAPTSVHVIADQLRDEILRGDLADGATLPPLDELLDRFGASRPTLRQALRILEAEGLLSVRRGRHGGSVVHCPGPSGAAYAFELLLRSGRVEPDDLSVALREIEPLCAGMCARRADRDDAVVPYLRAVHAEGRQAVEDPEGWARAGRRFHEELVRRCGNATLAMVVGAVESVCTAHARAWAQGATEGVDLPIRDEAYRHRGLDDHALILAFIERGDADAAAREARNHLQWVPAYPVPRPDKSAS